MTLSDVHPVGGLEIGFLLTRGHAGSVIFSVLSTSTNDRRQRPPKSRPRKVVVVTQDYLTIFTIVVENNTLEISRHYNVPLICPRQLGPNLCQSLIIFLFDYYQDQPPK